MLSDLIFESFDKCIIDSLSIKSISYLYIVIEKLATDILLILNNDYYICLNDHSQQRSQY